MIADLLPRWLWQLVDMGKATLPANEWTWRHFCRYGTDPARIAASRGAGR
jgi:hypothetical protein